MSIPSGNICNAFASLHRRRPIATWAFITLPLYIFAQIEIQVVPDMTQVVVFRVYDGTSTNLRYTLWLCSSFLDSLPVNGVYMTPS
jgi:hypothetical protein